jgi:hypothetical protein
VAEDRRRANAAYGGGSMTTCFRSRRRVLLNRGEAIKERGGCL